MPEKNILHFFSKEVDIYNYVQKKLRFLPCLLKLNKINKGTYKIFKELTIQMKLEKKI